MYQGVFQTMITNENYEEKNFQFLRILFQILPQKIAWWASVICVQWLIFTSSFVFYVYFHPVNEPSLLHPSLSVRKKFSLTLCPTCYACFGFPSFLASPLVYPWLLCHPNFKSFILSKCVSHLLCATVFLCMGTILTICLILLFYILYFLVF